MYDKIKKFYDYGLYTNKMVANFVKKKVITTEEYELITGEAYNG